MKKNKLIIGCVILTVGIALSGCASVAIPRYIKDEHPYEKVLYAGYDTAVKATTSTLEEMGWEVVDSADPAVYERTKRPDNPYTKQILLFTNIRQTPMFIGTRYQRANVYLKSSGANTTDIEIRYVTVSSIPFKAFYSYNKTRTVNGIFKRIENKL